MADASETAEGGGLIEAAVQDGATIPPMSADLRALLFDLVPLLADLGTPLPGSRAALIAVLGEAMAGIDRRVEAQINVILHAPAVMALEASWRGLGYLVTGVYRARLVKVKMMNASWAELSRDIDRAVDTEDTVLFDLLYNGEFDRLGGEPFGLVIGDYQVAHRPVAGRPGDDIATLRGLADLAATIFCPFVLGVHPALFGVDTFTELEGLRDMPAMFRAPEYVRWNALRSMPDTRFIGLVFPRVLHRPPYRRNARASGAPPFEERLDRGRFDLVWGSAVYPFAAVAAREFAASGWFASMRGARPGEDLAGQAEGLASYDVETDAPGVLGKGSMEVLVTADLEKELFDLGIVPLVPCPRTGLAAFFECPSLHLRPASTTVEGRQTQRLNAMLNYVLCVARFGHCLKMMGRFHVGALRTEAEVEERIRDWLRGHTIGTDDASSEAKARDPLRDFDCKVRPVPGMPGVMAASIMVQPHYQFDEIDSGFELAIEFNRSAR